MPFWDENSQFMISYKMAIKLIWHVQANFAMSNLLICPSDRPFPNFSPIFYCISTLFVSNSLVTKTRLYRSDFSFP